MNMKISTQFDFFIKKGIIQSKSHQGLHWQVYFLSQAYNMQGKKGIVVDPCPICGSKFTHVFRTNSHMKYCGDSLSCEICGKSFKSKQALVGHQNAKHQEKFKCDLCGKCFENLSKLDRHKIAQNVEKSFTCPKCEKKFLRKDNMLQHIKNIH